MAIGILEKLKGGKRLKDIDALPEKQKQTVLKNIKSRGQTLKEAGWYSSSGNTKITMGSSVTKATSKSKKPEKKKETPKYKSVQTVLEEQGYQGPTDKNGKFRPITDEDLANGWGDKISYPTPEKQAVTNKPKVNIPTEGYATPVKDGKVDYSQMMSKIPEGQMYGGMGKKTEDTSWIGGMSTVPAGINNKGINTDTASYASGVTSKPAERKRTAPKMPDMQMMSYQTEDLANQSRKYPGLSIQEEQELDSNPMLSEIMKESVYKEMFGKKQQDAWLQDRANIRKQYISGQATTGDKDQDKAIVAQSQAADIIRNAIVESGGKGVGKIDDMSLLTAVAQQNPYTSNIISGMANGSIDDSLAQLYLLDGEEYEAAMNLYSDFVNTESQTIQSSEESQNIFKDSNIFVRSLMNVIGGVVGDVEGTLGGLAELGMEGLQWADKKLGTNFINQEQWDKAQDDVYNWFTSFIPEEKISDKDSWMYKAGELGATIFGGGKIVKGLRGLKWLSKADKLRKANLATRVIGGGIAGAGEGVLYQGLEDLRKGEMSSGEDYANMMSLSSALGGFGGVVGRGGQKFVNSKVGKKVVSLVKGDGALSTDTIKSIENDVKEWSDDLSKENPLIKRKDAMVGELKEGLDKKLSPLKTEKTALENKLSELGGFSTEKSINSLNKTLKDKGLGKIEIQFDKKKGIYKVVGESKKVGAKEQLNKFVDALNGSENLENVAGITDIESISKEISKLKESNTTVSKALTEWSSNLSKGLDGEAKEVVSKIQSLNKEMSPYLEARDRILSESDNILQAVGKMESAETPLYRDLEMMYKNGVLNKHYGKELFGTFYTQALRSPKKFKALLDLNDMPYPSIPGLYETGIKGFTKSLVQSKGGLESIAGGYSPNTKAWDIMKGGTMGYGLGF